MCSFIGFEGKLYRYKRNPLHKAAINGHLNVVEYLFHQKSNHDAKDKQVYLIGPKELLFIQHLSMITY